MVLVLHCCEEPLVAPLFKCKNELNSLHHLHSIFPTMVVNDGRELFKTKKCLQIEGQWGGELFL